MKVVCIMEDTLSNTEITLSKNSEKGVSSSTDEILISTSSGMEICLDVDELRKALDILTGKKDNYTPPITLPERTPLNEFGRLPKDLEHCHNEIMCER